MIAVVTCVWKMLTAREARFVVLMGAKMTVSILVSDITHLKTGVWLPNLYTRLSKFRLLRFWMLMLRCRSCMLHVFPVKCVCVWGWDGKRRYSRSAVTVEKE